MIFFIFYQANLTGRGLFKWGWCRNRLLTWERRQQIIFYYWKNEKIPTVPSSAFSKGPTWHWQHSTAPFWPQASTLLLPPVLPVSPRTSFCTLGPKWLIYLDRAFLVFLIIFNNKKWFLAFFIKLIWLGVGFLNRTGAEVGY